MYSTKHTRFIILLKLQLYIMDIAPNYSGAIFGLAFSLGNMAGVVNSALLGTLIEGNVSFFFDIDIALTLTG